MNKKHTKQMSKISSKPLLCIFYAEFDNTVGTKICFQHPKGFMDKCILNYDKQLLEHNCQLNHSGSIGNTSGYNFYTCSSLFSAVSDYCIAGPELADTVLCVSTHGLHVLTMPSIIYNKDLYERNSLLFSIGFVLKGLSKSSEVSYSSADDLQIRPYRPLLFKTVETLRTAEIESQYLTKTSSRPLLQSLLCQIFDSLNSNKMAEANILLNEANVLHLKLFKPPKPLTPPVPDFVVPVLLRPEGQLQMFDWDLTINWIVPHIDGVKTTKAISEASEVDLEMVRACLRVLRHHDVLTFVDIFQYSNHYESSLVSSEMFCGLHPKLLDTVFHFAARGGTKVQSTPTNFQTTKSYSSYSENERSDSAVKWSTTASDNHQQYSLSSSPQVASSPKLQPLHHGSITCTNKLSSLSEDATDKSSHDESNAVLDKQLRNLAHFYCSFKRDESLSDLLLRLVSESKEWKDFLEFFDLRRCIIFGIIHGLCVRTHDFPLAVCNDDLSMAIGDKVDYIEVDNMLKAMDGTTRDDELCCMFNRPFQSILELISRDAPEVLIIHNYSPSS